MKSEQMTKCVKCKRRKAVWRVGRDGFSSKPGARICDNWSCRTWATGGYPVTLHGTTADAEAYGTGRG